MDVVVAVVVVLGPLCRLCVWVSLLLLLSLPTPKEFSFSIVFICSKWGKLVRSSVQQPDKPCRTATAALKWLGGVRRRAGGTERRKRVCGRAGGQGKALRGWLPSSVSRCCPGLRVYGPTYTAKLGVVSPVSRGPATCRATDM